jgi:hypothetical protein
MVFLQVLFLLISLSTALSSSVFWPSKTGFEIATLVKGNNSKNAGLNERTGLQFVYNGGYPVNGWWCVRMYDSGASQANYVCTSRDIGLVWRWSFNECRTNIKCTNIVEHVSIGTYWWSDNAFCLPLMSNIEIVWSECGRLSDPRWSCIYVFIDARFPNNHLCWREL